MTLKELIAAQSDKTDIFNNYSDLSPLRLYTGMYNEIPNEYRCKVVLDKDKFEQYITNTYRFTKDFYAYFLVEEDYDEDNGNHFDKHFIFIFNEHEHDTYGITKDIPVIIDYFGDYFLILCREDYNYCEKLSKKIIEGSGGSKDILTGNFNILIHNQSGFNLSHVSPVCKDTDINLLYNDDFKAVDEKITSFLNTNDSGVLILHGKQGTGKTSYIRHLINNSKEKKIIYLTPDTMEYLASPDFIGFMLKNGNSIIILEDCEELLRSRKGSNKVNSGLINILNMADGLLGDVLHIKFICTFNDDIKDIDAALQRKGRLKVRYEFKPLTEDKVRIINEKMNLNIPEVNIKEMTLAEIFNFNDVDYTKVNNKIGIV